jgi:replicative DNA helicase
MTIIAGRPKHGKTTFLYNLMMQMVESGLYVGKKFYFFSYEESGNRLKQKMLCRLIAASGASASKLAVARKWDIKSCGDLIQRYAQQLQADPSCPRIPEIEAAAAKLDALLGSVEIVTDPLSVEELDRVIHKLNEREVIGAIFIDYIQRIPSEKKTNSIREDVNHISDTLKWCAVHTGLPLIVGAQINRGSTDKTRPAQGDLKESGALEEDANQVLCVYNESQGAADSSKGAQVGGQQTVEVFTLCSRDTEHSTTKFVLTERLFREA